MTSNPPLTAPRRRWVLAVGAASILCTALAACSTGTPAAPDPAKAPGVTSPAAAALAQSAPALPPSSPTDTAESSPTDAAPGAACALLTVKEVTTATGKPMTIRGDSPTICVFSATADPSDLLYVQLYLDPQSMTTLKDGETSSQHIPGLGDDAFYGGGIMFVQKGSHGFSILTPSLAVTGDAPPPQILSLAHAALPRFKA